MVANIYQRITDVIVQKLAEGTIPWRRPWSTPHAVPRSVATGKPYRGINVLVLACQGYADPRWLTYRQAQKAGGNVVKGEKGTAVMMWKFPDKAELAKAKQAGKKEPRCFARAFTVFNLEQTEGVDPAKILGLPDAPEPGTFDPLEQCEGVVTDWAGCPPIRHQGSQAFYTPSTDQITIPGRDYFAGEPEYYSTLFHEMTHATGHSSRLARSGITEPVRFGTKNYSREELVAELGAAFLCGHTGIENETLDNSAAYCRGWLLKLKADARLIPTAAQQAQKAADLILGHASPADNGTDPGSTGGARNS